MELARLADLPDQAEVLIAGGGPAGLALAIELAHHGVPSLVVERRTAPSPQPGAKLCNLRTMELMRRWGLADEVRAAAELPADFPMHIQFVTDLSGHPLGRIPHGLRAGGTDLDAVPETSVQIPQYALEHVLAGRVAESPLCTVLRGAEITTIEPHDYGVVATVVAEDGGVRQVDARWLVGCDGASSVTRQALGIGMTGGTPAAMNLAIVLDSTDIDVFERFGPAVHYWTVGLVPNGLFGPLDGRDRWWMHLHGFAPGTKAADLDVPALVQQTLGRPTEVDIVDVSPWNTHALIADAYRRGRVLLVGDAAHLHPPMGGYGMNMAIGDAVDVGWKLAAVLRDRAPDALLDTYEVERRPVHRFTIDEAIGNYRQLQQTLHELAPVDPDVLRSDSPAGSELRNRVGPAVVDVKRREFASAGLQLGFSYAGSPLIVDEDEKPAPPWSVTSYTPTARPGTRLPHVVRADGSYLLDQLHGFTVVQTSGPDDAAQGLLDEAQRAGLPLHVVRTHDPDIREQLGADLLLVRPDTVVAWRGSSTGVDLGRVLRRAVGLDLVGSVSTPTG